MNTQTLTEAETLAALRDELQTLQAENQRLKTERKRLARWVEETYHIIETTPLEPSRHDLLGVLGLMDMALQRAVCVPFS